MREVVIVDGIRVPIGKAGKDKGYYKDIRGDDLGAICIRRLLRKAPRYSSNVRQPGLIH